MKSFALLLLLAICYAGCSGNNTDRGQVFSGSATGEKPPLREIESQAIREVLKSAVEQTTVTTGYTQDYFVLSYPDGDVPIETGACTDVVVRAFRKAGVDLQKEVHEEMSKNFSSYPKK